MPMISKSDLNGKDVKPGDEITFKVDSINGDQVELSYNNPMVESEPKAEMSMEEMNDPTKVKSMDSMSSDEMKKVLPKKVY